MGKLVLEIGNYYLTFKSETDCAEAFHILRRATWLERQWDKEKTWVIKTPGDLSVKDVGNIEFGVEDGLSKMARMDRERDAILLELDRLRDQVTYAHENQVADDQGS